MSKFRRSNIIIEQHCSPSIFTKETSLFALPTPTISSLNPFASSSPFSIQDDAIDYGLDLLAPSKYHHHHLLEVVSPFDDFDPVSDLIRVETTPLYTATTHRVIERRGVGRLGRLSQLGQLSGGSDELYLQGLSDRVAALELGFDKLVSGKKSKKVGERRYTWTAEIKSPEKDGFDRKYKWTAEVKDGKKKGGSLDRNYKFTTEIKGKGEDSPIKRTYKFEASAGNAGERNKSKSEKNEKKNEKKKAEGPGRIVEITDASDHGAVVLRQAFAKRVEKVKGKKKELSPQDAAISIQMSFRAYLIRRSQALRALRELAIAKNKLKELRALFNNFSYRRRVAHDAAERQSFSEKIIVLLLTVDAVEGADLIVRAVKRSMVDELETMLDVVDPQPAGRSLSLKRRAFDMPDGVIQKQLAAGVAQVVQMLDEDGSASET